MAIASDYMAELAKRAKESRVYRSFQLQGLEIADLLGDRTHKALYIRLVKERGGDGLLRLAKDIATRDEVKNKGAYFMACIKTSDPTSLRLRRSSAGQASDKKMVAKQAGKKTKKHP